MNKRGLLKRADLFKRMQLPDTERQAIYRLYGAESPLPRDLIPKLLEALRPEGADRKK
jgi:hypothetical protein